MFKLAVVIFSIALTSNAYAAGAIQPQLSFQDRVRILQGQPVYNAACCKTCRKGKACGDSCISKSYTCRKGVGCACDG